MLGRHNKVILQDNHISILLLSKALTVCLTVNRCHPPPCENGGDCTIVGSGFVCTCPPGYTGETCEIGMYI